MFGRTDDQSPGQDTNTIPDTSINGALQSDNPAPGTAQPAAVPTSGVVHPTSAPLTPGPAASPSAPAGSDDVWQHPGTPLAGPTAAGTTTASSDSNTPEDLLTIKQQALGQLSPLLGTLDQTPEEKFRTLMMMIQASDNQSLIKTAYEVAEQITDEKVRAQALLDIVNEINYFTAQPPKN